MVTQCESVSRWILWRRLECASARTLRMGDAEPNLLACSRLARVFFCSPLLATPRRPFIRLLNHHNPRCLRCVWNSWGRCSGGISLLSKRRENFVLAAMSASLLVSCSTGLVRSLHTARQTRIQCSRLVRLQRHLRRRFSRNALYRKLSTWMTCAQTPAAGYCGTTIARS